MPRQTTVKTSGKGAKHCELCGAKTWLFDDQQQRWSGPWHFNDCESLPGAAELSNRNTIARLNYDLEQAVPREKGRLVLKAILALLDAPSNEAMLARKQAILEEIKKL